MTGLTPFQEEVYAQLDHTWKRLDEIAAGTGRTLSGSGFENTCDRLVEMRMAVVKKAVGAPMGKAYRRVL